MAARPWLAVVLELYAPPEDPEGKAVVEAARACFRPLLALLARYRNASVTLALDPGLARMLLRHGQAGILQEVAAATERGQVELAGGARNHALLPRLPRREVERQIRLGHEEMVQAMGRSWRPQGLMPPALAWSRHVGEVAADRGLRWVLADELALGRLGDAPRRRVATLRGRPDVLLFFRDRAVSRCLSRGENLGLDRGDGYRVAVVPGIAFCAGSASLAGMERLLAGDGPMLTTLSTLASAFPDREAVEPLPSSWRTTVEELAAGLPFAAWSAPDNEIHALLWRLVALGLAEAQRLAAEDGTSAAFTRMRTLLDEGLHTAPFRFASGRPWWQPEAVRRAARRLGDALEASGEIVCAATREEAALLLARIDEALEAWARHRSPDRLWAGTGAAEEDAAELAG